MKTFITFFIFFLLINNSFAKSVLPSNQSQTAYLAGGCFWGMQELLRDQKGVIKTEVGYMGDLKVKNPNYNLIKTGTTQFAETVKIVFDEKKLSYKDLLKFFFKIHDPSTKNQQGNDKGLQYRSVIFYTNLDQKAEAEILIEKMLQKKIFSQITTEISKASTWYSAEDYHQDYLQKNPGGYTCHYVRKINLDDL